VTGYATNKRRGEEPWKRGRSTSSRRPGEREAADREWTFAGTKAQQDRFAQHLREEDDFEDAVEEEMRGEEPDEEPPPSDPMPM
jgi:hypothetical protein